MTDKYALRYSFNEEYRDEGYTKEDATEGKGLCDAIIGISIIYQDDGSYSQAVFSANGKTKAACTPQEIFKAWHMLGMSLHEEGLLKGWHKDCVKLHAETARAFFKALKEIEK